MAFMLPLYYIQQFDYLPIPTTETEKRHKQRKNFAKIFAFARKIY